MDKQEVEIGESIDRGRGGENMEEVEKGYE